MKTLNLETKNKEQEIIKNYLQENVSEILAEKINNGVKIVKDNKNLINKKTLDSFMQYASTKAKKLAQNQSSICIEDTTVFAWAIHYFEEDTIEGILLNEDGTPYKVEVKTQPAKVEVKQEVKKVNAQPSLFDFVTNTETKPAKVEPPIEKIDEPKFDNFKDELFDEDDYEIDKTTGEVLSPIKEEKQTDNYFEILNNLLDNKLIDKE